MDERKKILLMSNSERGQANVMLAVFHELLLHPEFDVHVASFQDLKARFTEEASKTSAEHATFHTFPAPSMIECVQRSGSGDLSMAMHAPTVKGALAALDIAPEICLSWTEEEYLSLYNFSTQLITTLNPAVVVLDPLLSQGIDACQFLQWEYFILTPLSLQQTLTTIQPKASIFCKYPAIGSGYPFPLPLHLVLPNIYRVLRSAIAFTFTTNPRLKTVNAYRLAAGAPSPMVPCFNIYHPTVHYLTPALPEIEYPYLIPDNVTLCSPIQLPTPPVSETDPDLHKWLEERSTILINLGSHIASNQSDAFAIATGLRTVLTANPHIQVLWKLKPTPTTRTLTSALPAILPAALRPRLKITPWLTPDPLALLLSGTIICSVHHGGANSFYEALKAGIPHLVLPVWFDTYDFAAKSEFLGVGFYGNKSSAPHIAAEEFAEKLGAIIGEREPAVRMRRRARELGEVCMRSEGRVVACERIMEAAKRGKVG
ncbi:hypothetical protein MMC30_007139 [Trapelia coarctata]|nr:hypothetical protein [Trapelia coarctata]